MNDSTDPAGTVRSRVLAVWGALRSSKVGFVIWVAIVALVVTPLVFSASVRLGPGAVDASIRPAAAGSTELQLPPLGSVRAATHRAPVGFELRLREVDVLEAITAQQVDTVSARDPRPVVEAAVRDDLSGAIIHVAVTLLLVAAAVGAAAALAFPGRRDPWRMLAGVAIGPLVVAGLVAPAAVDFDPTAFERSPTLTGQLGSADELLVRLGSLETPFGSVGSRTRVLSERLAGLYSATVTDQIERSDGEVVLLHVSDLHLNAVGLALARDLATSFDVDAVVDTGDITSFGFAPEAEFVDLLGDFEVPYYVVPGNHDSMPVRARLDAADEVIVLDGEMVEIEGLRVLGVADPTVTALRRIPREEIDATYEAQWPLVRSLVIAEQPDLLLVHSPQQVETVLGLVPVIAAGHLHRTVLEVIDGTVLTVAGTSGATGVGNLLLDEEEPYQFQVLRFVENQLVAVDQIELRGAGGEFQMARRVIDLEDEGDRSVIDESAEVDEVPREEVDPDDLDQVTSTTIPEITTTIATTTTTDGD